MFQLELVIIFSLILLIITNFILIFFVLISIISFIGDGGNEVGMGKAYPKIISSSIPNADKIACIVKTDHLLVSSVSNWGGYALSASLGLFEAKRRKYNSNLEYLEALANSLPSDCEEIKKCQLMIKAGAHDGVTRVNDMYVDGMHIDKSIKLINNFKNLLR